MSLPNAGSASDPSSHLYPQAIQLKLYQAFIFSIPVLFSIILFLLFYLFYLKKRSLAATSASASLSMNVIAAQSSNIDSHSLYEKGLSKEKLKEIMPSVPFNEDLQAKDAICCVCLGDFEMAEELIQIPVCKHIFHLDCIHNWLISHLTCPLCRSSIYLPFHNKKLIIVSTPLSTQDLTDIVESDHSNQVVITLASLQSQEHVIEVSDLLDRVANMDNTNTSNSHS